MNRHWSKDFDSVETTGVLVVGAGPAGLVTAIGLARHGVPALLVERRADLSSFPRATAISPRTMEIMRGWGLEQRVRDVGFEAVPLGRVAPTLISPQGETVPLGFPTEEELGPVSPTTYAVAAQDAFEPVLADEARTQGSDIRFGTELVALHQEGEGITAMLRDVTTHRRWAVRARYLVGADGARSAVRAATGITMTGQDDLEEFVSTLFRAPLGAHVGTPYGLNMIPGPTGLVVMLPTGGDRWVHAQTWDPDTQTLLEFTPERMTEMIRVASGVANLPVQILSTNAFSFAAQVADSFRSDRVFLVGDAAHRMTPRGGAGMNTAIHDAHNLAWKLAFVMRGLAGQGLLDTYEQERRPIGEANTRRSAEPTSTTLDALAIDIGVTYERGALAPEAAWPQAAEQSWQPTGRPGARLPHVWLERDGERRSTLDLLGPGLTVFTGSEGAHWQTAARDAAAGVGADIRVLVVGRHGLCDPADAFEATYGLDPDGAVVVRPDGHIAWRSRSSSGVDAAQELRYGIGSALGEPAEASDDVAVA